MLREIKALGVVADMKQNGSRLGEHRKPRVPFISWALLAALVTAMLILLPMGVKAQEYKPYKETTGVLIDNANICYTSELSTEVIALLGSWTEANILKQRYLDGGAEMPREMEVFGHAVADSGICAALEGYYDIDIIRGTEGYVLARFDASYDYDAGPFIVSRKDILIGEKM